MKILVEGNTGHFTLLYKFLVDSHLIHFFKLSFFRNKLMRSFAPFSRKSEKAIRRVTFPLLFTAILLIFLTVFLTSMGLSDITDNASNIHGSYFEYALMYSTYVFFIFWLVDHQKNKALQYSRKFETLLKYERAQREKIVYEQTQELRKSQSDRLNTLVKMADFGMQASSFFHDIVNPINIIALSLEEIKRKQPKSRAYKEINREISNALRASRKVDEYIETTRLCFRNQILRARFSVSSEIDQAIQLILPRATQMGVELVLDMKNRRIQVFGSKSRFYQVVSNLLNNALDAYEKNSRLVRKRVEIKVIKLHNQLKIEIRDCAGGMSSSVLNHIFEPFFSTKGNLAHLGIGLSICKQIVEQEMQGTLSCKSDSTSGETTFLLLIPGV